MQTRQPRPATDNQKDYIFQLADQSKVDAEEVSRRLTGRSVDQLSMDDASKVIDSLKSKGTRAKPAPLKGVEKYAKPLRGVEKYARPLQK